ncbi:hypothetical protein Syun_027985 [Stephania yunnanensis]|uniref:Uncharacterized protein n=1 Tax=Stephania yunnanensis TaxID=152371 RepID=A0AAP0HNB5_9MAGN
MAEVSRNTLENHPKIPSIEDGVPMSFSVSTVAQHHEDKLGNNDHEDSFCSVVSVLFLQKLIAETMGTFFLVFAGCSAIVVNLNQDKVVTLPGVALTWGLALVAIVYSIGHVSGAHINPAVTIAFASCGRFPWRQVPGYVSAQILGATVANGALRLVYSDINGHFPVNAPPGSNLHSLVIEFIITFFLMFVIASVTTDDRAVGSLAGLAIGVAVMSNILYSAPISGASMNPARTIGAAIIWNRYKGVWIYILGPTFGAIAGAWAYNVLRSTPKPLPKTTKL